MKTLKRDHLPIAVVVISYDWLVRKIRDQHIHFLCS